jgi:hypothetical protein
MAKILKEDVHQAASLVHRSSRTIRRWIAQGIDIRDATGLQKFANQMSDHAFGRQGVGARSMGQKGGSRTSDAKRRSSQANGKRGGRPKDGMLLLRKAIRDERWVDLQNAHDEDLRPIWSALVAIHKEYFFWVGDFLNEIEKRHGMAVVKSAASGSQNSEDVLEAMRVCAFLGDRRFRLSFRHHREACRECAGNRELALKWLGIAQDSKWNVQTMRAAIRMELADRAPDPDKVPKRQPSTTTIVRKATKALREVVERRPVDDWSLNEVNVFVEDAEPLLQIVLRFYERLEQNQAVR